MEQREYCGRLCASGFRCPTLGIWTQIVLVMDDVAIGNDATISSTSKDVHQICSACICALIGENIPT